MSLREPQNIVRIHSTSMQLVKLPYESGFLVLTLPEGASCEEMVHDQPIEKQYEEFISPDTEMDVLNKSIEIIGESPIKKQRLKS